MGEEGARVGARLARGCRCFAVSRGNEVVAYGWLSTHPEWIGELSLEISPGAGEAYIWNCVTLPAHRRQGMYRILLEGIVAKARAEAITRLWIGSIEDPAEKADADAGFKPVLDFTVDAFGPLRLLRARPAQGVPGPLLAGARRSLGLHGWTHFGRRSPRVH
jgi:GNAT superfamily N-acetyltransferase